VATSLEIAQAIQNAKAANDEVATKELLDLYKKQKRLELGLPLEPTQRVEKSEEEATFLDNVLGGLGTGFTSTAELVALGGATILEEEDEVKSREKIKNFADSFKPERGDKDSITYGISQAIGSTGAFLTTAAAAAATKNPYVAGITALATPMLAGAGEASERARDFGATEKERNLATLQGAGVGALDRLTFNYYIRKLPGLPKSLDKLMDKVSPQTITGIRSRLQRMAATGSAELAQESASAVLQNLVAQGYNPEQVLVDAGVLEEGAYGGAGGAILKGLIDVFNRKARVTEAIDDKPADPPEEFRTEEPETVDAKETPKTEEKAEEKVEEKQATEEELEAIVEFEEADTKETKDGGTKDDAGGDRESIPSSPTELGDERTASTEGAPTPDGQPVDRAVDTTGRDTGRKRREYSPLVEKMLKVVQDSNGARPVINQTLDFGRDKLPKDKFEELKLGLAERFPFAQKQAEKVAKKPDPARPDAPRTINDIKVTTPNVREFAQKNGINLFDIRPSRKDGKVSMKDLTSFMKNQEARAKKIKEGARTSTIDPKTGKLSFKDSSVRFRDVEKSDAVTLKAIKDNPEIIGVVQRGKDKKAVAQAKIVTDYLGKFNTFQDAMLSIANDIADPKNVAGLRGESAEFKAAAPAAKITDPKVLKDLGVKNIKKGTSVDAAPIVRSWFEANLSEKAKTLVDNEVETAKKEIELQLKTRAKYTVGEEQEYKRRKIAEEREKLAKDKKAVKALRGVTTPTRKRKQRNSKEIAETQFNTRINKELDFSNIETYSALNELAVASKNPKDNKAKLDELYEKQTGKKASELAKQSAKQEATDDVKRDILKADKELKEQEIKDAEANLDRGKKKAPPTSTQNLAKKLKKKYKSLSEKVIYGAIRHAEQQFPFSGVNAKTSAVAAYVQARTAKELKKDYKSYIDSRDIANMTYDLRINKSDIEALENVLSDNAMDMLRAGDLKGVVQSIVSENEGTDTSALANLLVNFVGDAKLVTATTKELGTLRGGMIKTGTYDPKTNTISINTDIPVSAHAVLHELSHAATQKNLKKKGDKYTKQFQTLFDDVKDSLDTAYGTKNLDEFVAELYSNIDFRNKVARVTIKGQNVSAWTKFRGIVVNLIRRIQGKEPIEFNALKQADNLIVHILAVNPTAVDNESLSLITDPVQLKELLGRVSTTNPYKGSNKQAGSVERIIDGLIDAKEGSTKLLYEFLDGQAIGDAGRKYGFGDTMLELDRQISTTRGLIRDNEAEVVKAYKKFQNWAKSASDKQKSAMNRVAMSQEYGATIHQVDPYKNRDDYANRTSSRKMDAQLIWDKQRKDFDAIGEEGRAALRTLVDNLKSQRKQLESSINTQIDSLLEGNQESKKKLKTILNSKIFKDDALDFYLPLVRKGEHKVQFDAKITAADGTVSKERIFQMFQSRSERDSFVETLRGNGDVSNIETFKGDIDKSRYENPPNKSMVEDVLQVLSDANVNQEVQDKVVELYINQLPETSFAKSFLRRKGTPGYIQDVGVAFEEKAFSLAAQTAKIETAAKVRAVMKDIEIKYKTVPAKYKQQASMLKNVARQRAKFATEGARNKGREKLYKNFNQTAFLYTLAGNLSAALIQLHQIPLVVFQYQWGKFGLERSLNSIFKATSTITASKVDLKDYYDQTGKGFDARFTVKESVKKKIRAVYDKKEADARIQELEAIEPLVVEANARGQLFSTNYVDELGLNERVSKWDKVVNLSAVAFNLSDKFNRQATLLSSYNLIRQDMAEKSRNGERYYSDLEGKFIVPEQDQTELRKAAAREALYFTQETNGGAVLETAPRRLQEGWLRVAGMYKTYGMRMYYTFLKSTKQMVEGAYANTPEGRAQAYIAFKQLLGIHLSTLFFSGVAGLPLYGMVRSLVDLFFLEDDEDDADSIVRKSISDAWYKGWVNENLGIDVANRVKLTDLILQENRFGSTSSDFSLEETIGFIAGGPFLSTVNRIPRAYKDFKQDFNPEAWDSLLPPAITNIRKGARYYEEGGIRTRREDFIYRDLSAGEVFSKMIGFAPNEYTKRMEVNARNKRVENAIIGKRSDLMKKFYIASKMGDWETAYEIAQDLNKFNKKHPYVAVTAKELRTSMDRHVDTTAKMFNGVTINDQLRTVIMQSNKEFED